MSQIPRAVRDAVLERDRGCCRFCGTPTTQLHHVIYRSQGGAHEATNLIALCVTHHNLVHSSKRVWMPILLATLKFNQKGVNLSVPQVQRWLGQEEAG